MATEAIATMLCYCSWNNQSFSACVIEDLQVLHPSTLPSLLTHSLTPSLLQSFTYSLSPSLPLSLDPSY